LINFEGQKGHYEGKTGHYEGSSRVAKSDLILCN
jgi:hypothetical protein